MLRFVCSIFMGKRCVCASATIWSNMIKWMKHKQMKNINRPKEKKLSHTNNVAKIINELNFIPTCQPLHFFHIHAFSIAQTSEKKEANSVFFSMKFLCGLCCHYIAYLVNSIYKHTEYETYWGFWTFALCLTWQRFSIEFQRKILSMWSNYMNGCLKFLYVCVCIRMFLLLGWCGMFISCFICGRCLFAHNFKTKINRNG